MKSYMLDLSRKSGDGKMGLFKRFGPIWNSQAWDGTQRQANRKDGVLTFSLVVTAIAVQSGTQLQGRKFVNLFENIILEPRLNGSFADSMDSRSLTKGACSFRTAH